MRHQMGAGRTCERVERQEMPRRTVIVRQARPTSCTKSKEVHIMRFNLATIMRRAWDLRREKGFSMMTALRIAWAEAKGEKVYTFNLDNARACITAYLLKLADAIHDEHDVHKYDILRAALLIPCDAAGIAVMGGKCVGLCKYAVRNA